MRLNTCSPAVLFVSIIAFMSLELSLATSFAQDAARDKLIVETLIRLKRFDVSDNEKFRGSVLRHMQTIKGSQKYIEYSELFAITEATPELLILARNHPNDNLGVNAINSIVRTSGTTVLRDALTTANSTDAVSLLTALGQSTEPNVSGLLISFYNTSPRNRQVLTNTALAISKTIPGQRFLLEQAEANKLPQEISFAVGNALYSSANKDIQARAKAAIQLPATADAKPLPPLRELIAMSGTVTTGKTLFFKKGTCAKCHKVGDQGKEVGPALSEIGSKLSKDAMFTSILDPSAGVSHNYETYSLITINGNIITGIKINDTDAEITLRTAEGIDKTVSRTAVDELIKTGVSLMPADIQRLLSIQELVDIVAYLRTLKKN
ncbi:MAG: hypothetical protein CMJ76_11405 [Planctomycetaceae bacterium]|nr:hypothetical protein [Planctomycetaceae bacterium]